MTRKLQVAEYKSSEKVLMQSCSWFSVVQNSRRKCKGSCDDAKVNGTTAVIRVRDGSLQTASILKTSSNRIIAPPEQFLPHAYDLSDFFFFPSAFFPPLCS